MKSPLKSRPLHNPGQSSDGYIQDFIIDKISPPILFAAGMVFVAFMEWYRWFTNSPPIPELMTAIAISAVLYAIIRSMILRKKLKALKLGRDGEIAVGQHLDLLREKGAKILHDIPGQGFNIDHVVIDESGIYVIETKTYSKPEKGQTNIIYDGGKIIVNGKEPERNPVIQVKAACSWLKELLEKSTGKEYHPKAVVLFPGWFVQPTAEAKNSDVWVLNPKALPAFISKSKSQLKKDEVNIFSYHLSRYVREESK
ncbi:MAG: nuclease-related domain-containing protein [Smithella sp.]|nr:nuclease-related domain-containing protein [Smithella sp.]